MEIGSLSRIPGVLKEDITVGGSPRSLSVLPAFRPKVRKTVVSQARETVLVNKPMATKKALSWADVVRK